MVFKDFLNQLEDINMTHGVQQIDVVYDGCEIRIKLELAESYFNFLENKEG